MPPEAFRFEELAPHLYLQVFPQHIDDGELQAFLAAIEREAPTLPRPMAWIADVARIERASSVQRRELAEFQKRMAPFDAEHCAGTAVVVRSPVVRGMVTAVYWLSPPVYPHAIVGSLDEGLRFVDERLAERGVALDVERARRGLERGGRPLF